MARFHYTTRDGKVVSDPDGVELPDVATARRQAVCFLGEQLRDQPDAFAQDRRLELTVTDDAGATMWVFTATMVHGPGDPLREHPHV